ncbi:MAG: pentapeptide repeat-containing protein, partial [bacterium]
YATNLYDADLYGANLYGARFCNTVMPDGRTAIKGC